MVDTFHKPINPFARKNNLDIFWQRLVIPISQVSEIDTNLYQSGMPGTPQGPTPDELRQFNQIVNCCWFNDAPELPDMSKLSSNADAIATLIHSGQKILIHCAAGINRSSLLTSLVLMRLHPTWSGAQTLTYLGAKRPGVLSNSVFRQYLQSLSPCDGQRTISI